MFYSNEKKYVCGSQGDTQSMVLRIETAKILLIYSSHLDLFVFGVNHLIYESMYEIGAILH